MARGLEPQHQEEEEVIWGWDMPADAEGNNISFTVKELLEDINGKVDALHEKLDSKADRDRVHDLINRLATLELTAVKREGPIVQEMRDYERRIDEIAAEIKRFENGVGWRIQQAIAEANRNAIVAADRSFTRREKLVVASAALVGAAGTVISTLVLMIQIT